MMKSKMTRVFLGLLTLVLAAQLTGCGTLFHGDRRGKQASTELDPEVVILDCCGLFFGIIPGAVALFLDFNNKTIYFTVDEYSANKVSSIDDIDFSTMKAVKMDEATVEAAELAISRELGRPVSLSSDFKIIALQ